MVEATGTPGIAGIVVTGDDGRVLASLGVGSDRRIRAMTSDPEWIAQAMRARMLPVRLTDESFVTVVSKVPQGHLIVLSRPPTNTVLDFILTVDFAYDIIDQILTDPYDAMVIVDRKATVAFISPIHEKFFGLRSGEGVGKDVRKVIENTRLDHVVKTGIAEVGQIQRMGTSERVVSRHPIRRDGEVVGAVGRVMFEGPRQLAAMSRRINALEEEIAVYKREAGETEQGEQVLGAIIGDSQAIRSIRQQIRRIAPLDIPVLIQGESGTGKELVARALHMLSPRQDARLVTVNAAALPESLVESELFGYEPGSFTGAASKGRPGKFELAHKGTIFLDEIGDMPLAVQSKLLRVLQDKMVERVGGSEPKRVDFRLCSATHHDLESFVDQGRFRLDLFYRISPIAITLPALAERIEDIPLLLNYFIGELAKQYSRPVPEIDVDVPRYLMAQPWPGNVRQLRHVLERAFIFADEGRLGVASFEAGSTLPEKEDTLEAATHDAGDEQGSQPSGLLKKSLEGVEKDMINDAMMRFDGNKKKVAEHLGISRSYLYKKLES